MNENIDLTKILRDCPKGWEFWSDNYGKVEFLYIDTSLGHPIRVRRTDGCTEYYTKDGWCNIDFPASCLLWPQKIAAIGASSRLLGIKKTSLTQRHCNHLIR